MKDADGNTIEEIGIANWKVEHIEEFRAPPPHTQRSHARPAEGPPRRIRCPPLQPPRPMPCASCREARPGGHRVSAGRRWVTFMTRGAKSSLSRWRCAETVVTPFFGTQPCTRARPPVALGATVDAFTGVRRAAAGRRERCVVVWVGGVARPAHGPLVFLVFFWSSRAKHPNSRCSHPLSPLSKGVT